MHRYVLFNDVLVAMFCLDRVFHMLDVRLGFLLFG